MALSSANLNDHLYSTNLALSDLFNNHTFAHDPSGLVPLIDSWVPYLQNSTSSVTTTAAAALSQLKQYVQSGDRANASALLQTLGEQASKSAGNIHEAVGTHLHNGLGDQMRHLGQLLIMASGNLRGYVAK
ncbi:hypothetical protein SAMN02745146_0987 [Hymenobacter daecheongensis DSM 21074]|uniref:Uncharacterized protein n=1 Tax=Hymenobacter daecheongensis DSM 21074 TaxID=1121955 RepID=A0A1M6C0U0_9BACT|nr:hypothetical protein [Hymenobacter daecheongensis]SHI54533.1 hypothetical protein SAMN02745146_0987 [Hymenobacter daecheongensis DSM 21074]